MAAFAPAARIGTLLPSLSPPTLFASTRSASIYVRHMTLPLFPTVFLAIPAAIHLNIPSLPSLLEGIWEGILKAVPKKKTTHSKKRHRQMAGKALKDVTALCKCPACGEMKRMHYLCPHCATKLRKMMNDQNKEQPTA